MCRVFEVSRSGYYRWLKRKPSQRQLENQRLDEQIREIYNQSKGRYGSPKITEELRDQGHRVGKNRVAKRMRKAGLRSKIRRKYRVTTDSKHKFPERKTGTFVHKVQNDSRNTCPCYYARLARTSPLFLFDDMGDLHALFPGDREIVLHVPFGIDDGHGFGPRAADDIGKTA
jgi:hypothetical protein